MECSILNIYNPVSFNVILEIGFLLLWARILYLCIQDLAISEINRILPYKQKKYKMTSEIKKHPIYSDYGADIEGNIYSFKFNKIKPISKVPHTRGYHQFGIWLTTEHKQKMYLIHRFVYECFNGMIPTGLQINHIDLDKQNNHLDNLEVVDQWMNMQHGIDNGVQYGAANPNHPLYYI